MKLPTSSKLKIFKSVSVALSLAGTVLMAHGATIIQNGSFEIAPYFDQSPAQNTGTVTDWIVGGTGIVGVNDYEGASQGSYAADFNGYGDSRGTTLSQSFTTIVGDTYTLSYDAGVFGNPLDGTQQMYSQVTDSSSVILNHATDDLDYAAENPPVAADVPFKTFGYTFTADSTTSTVLFEDMSPPGSNNSADTILDNVVITGPGDVPEPSTWAMLLAGLGFLLFRFRRKSNFQG